MTIEERVQQIIDVGGVIQLGVDHNTVELGLAAVAWLSRPARLRCGAGSSPSTRGTSTSSGLRKRCLVMVSGTCY